MSLPRRGQDTKTSAHPVYKLLCFRTKLSFNSTICLKGPAAEFYKTPAALLEFSLLRGRVSSGGMRDEKVFWH